MRRCGRIEPGSGGGVRTGHAVLFIPALTAITSAMLSFLVRPFIVGTVIGGSLEAESPAVLDALLDAVPRVVPALATVGVLEAVAAGRITSVDELSRRPSIWTWSPVAAGRAPLLAAQAAGATNETTSSDSDEYLLNRVECISLWGLCRDWWARTVGSGLPGDIS